MENWQVGDKVICIDVSGVDRKYGLKCGNIYTIEQIKVIYVRLSKIAGLWSYNRFHKVKLPHYLDDEWQC